MPVAGRENRHFARTESQDTGPLAISIKRYIPLLIIGLADCQKCSLRDLDSLLPRNDHLDIVIAAVRLKNAIARTRCINLRNRKGTALQFVSLALALF